MSLIGKSKFQSNDRNKFAQLIALELALAIVRDLETEDNNVQFATRKA